MVTPLLLFIFDSPTQIIFVIAILVLLFGAGRLPQLAKSLGQSRKAFKDALREGEEEEERERASKVDVVPPAAQITAASVTPAAPHLMSQMTDEELESEMRRRSEMRAEH